jgi:hypothetical protein
MTDLLEDVREATAELAELAQKDGVLWPRMAVALRATCSDVTRRLTSKELAVLVMGDGGKRILVNTAVGEILLRPEAREPAAVVLVRSGDAVGYACELTNGGTLHFANTVPEKARIRAAAEAEVARAEEQLDELRRRVEEVRAREAAPLAPASFAEKAKRFAQSLIVIVWAWVKALVQRAPRATGTGTVALRLPEAAPPLAKDERFDRILELERALVDAEPRLVRAQEALLRARADESEHAEERSRVFLSDVRALTDADARGGELVEIAIDHPASILPRGLVLVDAPQLAQADERERDAAWKRVRDDLAGCIIISPGGRTNLIAPGLATRLDPIAPHGVRGLVPGLGAKARAELEVRLRGELPALFARIREESSTVVAARATRSVRERVGKLTRACATTTAEVEAQIAAAEERRSRAIMELRMRVMHRVAPELEEASHRVLQNARETLRARVGALSAEWQDAITSCGTRAAIDACIAHVNATGPDGIRAICDGVADGIAKDAQAAGNALWASVLRELSVVDRKSSESAPVIVSVPSALSDADGSVPLATTHDAFEQRRVKIGLGGAAAGAALGTMIFPGVGTAVGAMVGVLAGFVEGTTSLKRKAIEQVRAHAAEVERQIAGRLAEAVPSVSRDLAASVGDGLERAIAERKGSIAAAFDETDRLLARERQKLDELARIRAMLAVHEERFVALSERAESALRASVAARAGSPRW